MEQECKVALERRIEGIRRVETVARMCERIYRRTLLVACAVRTRWRWKRDDTNTVSSHKSVICASEMVESRESCSLALLSQIRVDRWVLRTVGVYYCCAVLLTRREERNDAQYTRNWLVCINIGVAGGDDSALGEKVLKQLQQASVEHPQTVSDLSLEL